MKSRDVLTLIGSCCLAVGGPLVATAPSTISWWVGFVLTAIGPVLMGQRAFKHGNGDR